MGYLLLKNPSRVHSFDLPFGKAHVVYPELGDHSAASLLLDIDPVGLVRGRSKSAGESTLDRFVNDRPYVSSSFLSVAMSRVFETAMGGRSKERQELADAAINWTAAIAVASCRGGETFVRALFEPLGYEVAVEKHPLDDRFPEWGQGNYYTIRIAGTKRLQDLLTHIYVLVPVLDADKHYWVGEDEVEKLLKRGEGWLAALPERDAIASRYLRYDRRLTRDALARLADEDAPDPEAMEHVRTNEEREIEAPIRLWEQRVGAVMSALRALDAKTIVDLGCGEGKLLKPLLQDKAFGRLVGMDVSWRSLETARRRLYMDQMPDAQKKRIRIDEVYARAKIRPEGKTDLSLGWVAIPHSLADEIANHVARSDLVASDFLFESRRKGRPATSNAWLKGVLKPLAAKVGLEFIDLRVLRRTNATQISREAGVKAAQAQLRHARPDMTLLHYIGEEPEELRRALEALDVELVPENQPEF